MFHADNTYFYPALRIATRRLRTHTVSNTAFRGFGGPQGMIFAERMMGSHRHSHRPGCTRCAQGQSLSQWPDVTPYGMKVEDNIALEIIEQLEASSDYRERRRRIDAFNAENPILKKGLSLTR